MTDKWDELLADARVVILKPDDVVVLELPDVALTQEGAQILRARLAEAFADRRAVAVNGRLRIESQPA